MPENDNPTKVITGKLRLSYVKIFEPRIDDDGKAKYGCLLLIPKSDTVTMAKMRAAQVAAAAQGAQGKFNGKSLKGKPGTGQAWDTIKDGDEDEHEENAGHWLVNVSSNTKPGVVDRHRNPILDATEIYSGVYARVVLNCGPYNYQGKIGVTFFLNHVQKLADGTPLDGRTSAENEFDELDDEDAEEDSLI